MKIIVEIEDNFVSQVELFSDELWGNIRMNVSEDEVVIVDDKYIKYVDKYGAAHTIQVVDI